MSKTLKRKVALVILDGWGINPNPEGNTLRLANTPCFDDLFRRFPNTAIRTSGSAVGLPEGQMGNSEVGHMNLGSGRVIYQDFTRINRAIELGELAKHEGLSQALDGVRDRGGALHLYGLVSDGGVHSHQDHLHHLLDIASQRGVKQTLVHAVTDGRDTSPTEGIRFLGKLIDHIREINRGTLATVVGRYYAMDRDSRWERVNAAYRAIVHREGPRTRDFLATVQERYDAGETDEFLKPMLAEGEERRVQDGDLVICFNFRADRVRQMTRALTQPDFDEFEAVAFKELDYLCMTQYDASFQLPVLFPPSLPDRLLGQVIAEGGQRQLRIAETEKYAHVTYFFNGGEETAFEGEKRVLIPSPRVATYDLKPEMSAPELTARLIQEASETPYDLVVANFANCDMVGHTGKIPAAIAAVQAVDRAVGQLVPFFEENGYTLFLTADHGNVEQMVDYETGQPFTEHTLLPVPLLVTDPAVRFRSDPGKLADVAPTLLAYCGSDIPSKMDGDVLWKE